MLVKKENSSSAQVIPLTTAFVMFRDSPGYDGNYTMSLQPMVSTEKVFYPGSNALVIGQHQTYNENTNNFSGINQGINASFGGDGGSDGWGSSVNLTAELMGDEWYKEFNRYSNWCQFSEYPNNESANYYSGATKQVVQYIPNNINEKVDVSISTVFIDVTLSDNTANSAGIKLWPNHTATDKFEIKFNGTQYFEMNNRGYIVCTAINKDPYPSYPIPDAPSAVGYALVSNDFSSHDVWRTVWTRNFDKCISVLGNTALIAFSQTEQLYTSGLTARIDNIITPNNLNVTGNDIRFYFNTTGNGVTGKVQKGNQTSVTASVTANVEYTSAINRVQDHTVTNYNWANSTGTKTLAGGGGGYSYGSTAYIPYINKNLANPTDMSTVIATSAFKGFRMASKKNIPDTYGGTILFSGNNLNQYFNQNDKFYCIGFKGVSYYADGDKVNEAYNTYNMEGKFYKFNDEHFKKINNDTFVFFDDEISKIYTCFESNHGFGVKNRKYAPIGPFFVNFTGYTYVKDIDGAMHKTFDINSSNTYSIPTVLHTINYINSFDPEVNPDPRYIITKPASSIYYSSDGYDKNFGSTDVYSYLALQLPTNIVTGTPIYFENNVTEITQLGNSIKAITGLYRNSNPLTALTAVKATFDNCINVKQMSNLFNGATALKELPSDWGNLNRLTGAPSLCQDCSALTSVPDCYSLTNLNYAPNMYRNCVNVSSMPRGNLTALTSAPAMYEGCTNLTGNYYNSMIPPVPWHTYAPNLKNASNMFADCPKITDIQTDFNSLDLDYMIKMFMNCTAITSDIGPILDYVASHFYDNTARYASAFMGCTGVKSGVSSYQDIINDPTPAYEHGPTRADMIWKPLFGLT